MSLKYLGAPLDIHGGGCDLIFPHHENEIAQSEEATGVHPFARFWMHTGMVYLGPEKMSKSLGNMEFVRNLLPGFGSDALRLYLSGCHYRSSLHYDEADVRHAAKQAQELTAAVSLPSEISEAGIDLSRYRERFLERMNDDLDTPGAITVLQELAGAIHTAVDDHRNVEPAQTLLRELGGILGLRFEAEPGR